MARASCAINKCRLRLSRARLRFPIASDRRAAVFSPVSDMVFFLGLCLLSRFAYSLNDVFTGRLARVHGRAEVAAWRGVSLGITMAPLLLWVHADAWMRLGGRIWELLLVVVLTAASNLLHLHAARYLPFGLRAAFVVTGMAAGSVLLGWFVLGDKLSLVQAALCAVIVSCAVVAAMGTHASHEIQPNIRKGAWLALGAAALMACIAVMIARLSRTTDPLLTAWAWEFGSGLVLVAPVLWRYRTAFEPAVAKRVWRISVASAPTVIGSGASALALTYGALGVWAAVAGTQVFFTAMLGVIFHRETLGWVRWLCFVVAAAAVSGLAIATHS